MLHRLYLFTLLFRPNVLYHLLPVSYSTVRATFRYASFKSNSRDTFSSLIRTKQAIKVNNSIKTKQQNVWVFLFSPVWIFVKLTLKADLMSWPRAVLIILVKISNIFIFKTCLLWVEQISLQDLTFRSVCRFAPKISFKNCTLVGLSRLCAWSRGTFPKDG